MYRNKKLLLVSGVLFLVMSIFIAPQLFAQYWQALPPYNILWPLWTDALSPEDPITNFPAPLVNSLTSTTQLPVMPAFVWDIGHNNIWGFPYFLYNAPVVLGSGLYYYDMITGFNPFPPPNYTLAEGEIFINPLPVGYEYLIPSSQFMNFGWLTILANNEYVSNFYGIPGALGYYDLLQADELWGTPPVTFPAVKIW
ncbi:MAG: hypothetical protein ACMUJM_07085 [bacterium]